MPANALTCHEAGASFATIMSEAPTRPFCGRADELASLQQAFARLETSEPQPQLVVMIGESGLGKTRIVQEFYAWLSTQRDGRGDSGYWPDRLSADESYRDINPAAPCNAAVAPPFLWLGLPCRDQIEGLDGYASKLQPHLEPLSRLRERRRWGWEVGQKLLGGLSIVGEVIGVLLDLFKIGSGARVWRRGNERSARGFVAADSARHRQAVDRLIDSFADFLDAPVGMADARGLARAVERHAAGFRRVPAVLVIDDAQWADRSPAILQFVERLLARAAERHWPLMVIATHWQREWHERLGDPAAFAGLATRWATAREAGWAPLAVRPQQGAAYDALVQAALPGLPPTQRAVLLDRAGGNPRLLEEIVQHARINERLFVDRDPARALSDAGLAELRDARFDLHELIARRLAAAPRPVRAAAGLSAAQGLQFAEAFTLAAARRLGVDGVPEGLQAGIDPHALIFRVDDGVYAFAQGAYRDVARGDLANLFDPDEVRHVLADLVRADAADPAALAARSPAARRQARQAAVALLDDAEDPADRGLRAALLIQLGAEAADDWDYLTAARYAEEAAAVPGGLDSLPSWLASDRVSALGHALVELGQVALARRMAEAMWKRVAADGGDMGRVGPLQILFAAIDRRDGQGTPEAGQQMLTQALSDIVAQWPDDVRGPLLAQIAESQQLAQSISAAAARGDAQAEIDARLTSLRVQEAQADALGDISLPALNHARLKLMARVHNLALDGHPTLDSAEEVALVAAICRDARRHLAAQPDDKNVWASSVTAIVSAADGVTARGRPGALAAELEAVRGVVQRLAEGARSPVASNLAYRLFKHLAEAAVARGDHVGAIDPLRQATVYLRAEQALAPRAEGRIELVMLLHAASELAGPASDDGAAFVAQALEVAVAGAMPGAVAAHVELLVAAGMAHADRLMAGARHAEAVEAYTRIEAIVETHATLLLPPARLRALRNAGYHRGLCLLQLADEADEAAAFAAIGPMAQALDHADALVALGVPSPDQDVALTLRRALAEMHLGYGEDADTPASTACDVLATAEAFATADVPAVAGGHLADLLPRIAAARARHGCASF